MKRLVKNLLFITFLATLTSSAFALIINWSPGTTIQIIQSKFDINKSTVESAKIEGPRSMLNHNSKIIIKFKPEAAKELRHLAEQNSGKSFMVIINGRVNSVRQINSMLGSTFELSGLSEKEAEQLITTFQ